MNAANPILKFEVVVSSVMVSMLLFGMRVDAPLFGVRDAILVVGLLFGTD